MMRPGQAIVREVAAAHGIALSTLLSASKILPVVDAREEAAKRIRSELGYSTTVIGRILGRDHTTIIHLLQGRPCPPAWRRRRLKMPIVTALAQGRAVLQEVAAAHGSKLSELLSPQRSKAWHAARVEATTRMYNDLGYTVTLIARLMCRDHTTICYWLGIRRNRYGRA